MDTFGKKFAKSRGLTVINLEDSLDPRLLTSAIKSLQLTGKLNHHLIEDMNKVLQADALIHVDLAGFRQRKVNILWGTLTGRSSNASARIGFTLIDSQSGYPVWAKMVSLYEDVGDAGGILGIPVPLGNKPPAFEPLADKAADKAVKSLKKK